MLKKPIKNSYYAGTGPAHIEMPPLPEEHQEIPVEQNNVQTSAQQKEVAPVTQEYAAPQESNDFFNDQSDMVQEEEQEEVEDAPAQEVVRPQVKTQQENFKAIREAKEKAERERDILLQELAKRQSQFVDASSKKEVEPVDTSDPELDLLLDDEALVEGKHAKKMIQAMKKMREEMRAFNNKSTQYTIESRIKNNFPDFEKVVSSENVEMLNTMYPEIAQSLKDTSDMYTKAAAAYKVIKNMGIYKDHEEFMPQKQVINKNVSKPRPASSVSPQAGNSPLAKANSFANGLTPELQAQLRREMFEARKGH